MGVMLATSGNEPIALEAQLATGGEAADRFLRLADGELDRAYRLAGLILRDRHEAEDATQDAFCGRGAPPLHYATPLASRHGSIASSSTSVAIACGSGAGSG
jgi:hypothetical protein